VRLDLSTVLLQLATGGLFGCWVTTRRREVGLGYGWMLRSTYAVLAALAAVAGFLQDDSGTGATIRDVGAIGVALAATASLTMSVARRRAGVRGQRALREARKRRVAAMLSGRSASPRRAASSPDDAPAGTGSEFAPELDLVAPTIGIIAIFGAASAVGGPYALSAMRLLVGALFLGLITDAMLLGHWYLVQPGLDRGPVKELVRSVAVLWPIEVASFLWPDGMIQVLDGTIDDGFDGILGWTWVLCAITTIGLLGLTWQALKERSYSAVMAATGLLYLAILTAFGTDLIARAALIP
jgi:hypothetical protein